MIRARLCTLIAGVLAALLLGEVGLRVYDARPQIRPAAMSDAEAACEAAFRAHFVADATLDHVLTPGALNCTGPWSRLYSLHVNALGMNDYTRSEEPASGVYRILMLGDSFTQGWLVPWNHSLPLELERQLAAAKLPWRLEVLNGGIAGYSPVVEYIWLQRLVALQPALVILNIDLSDAQDDLRYSQFVAQRNKRGLAAAVDGLAKHRAIRRERLILPNVQFGWLLLPGSVRQWLRQHSHLYRRSRALYYQVRDIQWWSTWFERVVTRWRGQRAGSMLAKRDAPGRTLPARPLTQCCNFPRGRADLGNLREDVWAPVRPPPYYAGDAVIWGLTQRYVLAIQRLLQARGIALIVTIYPHSPTVIDFPELVTPAMYRHAWARFGAEHGIPVIDLFPAFARASQTALFNDDDVHFSVAGNVRAAREIAAYLLQRRLLGNYRPPHR